MNVRCYTTVVPNLFLSVAPNQYIYLAPFSDYHFILSLLVINGVGTIAQEYGMERSQYINTRELYVGTVGETIFSSTRCHDFLIAPWPPGW